MQSMNAAPPATQLFERHEAKYRIPLELVDPIREALRPYCTPDKAGEAGVYRIVSLYFDTADRALYRQTQDRAPRRYKLRVRRYESGPVQLEIKRRIKGIIAKSRVSLPAELWPSAFHDPRLLSSLSTKGQQVAYDFVNRCLVLDAQPAALVRYRREAWESRVDEYARVTFDDRIEGRQPEGWQIPFVDDASRWFPVDHAWRFGLERSGVVLELKSNMTIPRWMSDLVHDFRLNRSSFSKYSSALEAVDRRPPPPVMLPAWRLR